MSQSPVTEDQIDVARNADSEYRRSLANLNELLRQGGTLSGHEPNCAFLNTRHGAFATVSSVTGFDFADDARAIGLTDWDHDGDVDVWVANRTAPRLRYLQNTLPTRHSFVAFSLRGTTSNRDAIGARLTVTTANEPGDVLVKTLRAGEGYLSQSSKWLHFGLGDDAQIDLVTVTWPDGSTQSFRDLKPNRHYVMTQGDSDLQTWVRPVPAKSFPPAPAPPHSSPESSRIVLSNPLACPPLRYTSVEAGAEQCWRPGRMTLVNLWAAWCGPCLLELHEFAQHRAELQDAGVDVLALAIDPSLQPEDGAMATDQVIRQMKLPFAAGIATPTTLERLHLLQSLPFSADVELSVPLSLLISSSGNVAAIYRGRVSATQLINDAQQLSSSPREFAASAMPLPGRWNQPPRSPSSLPIGREMLAKGHVDDTIDFVQQFREQLAEDREFSKLLTWIGDVLISGDDPTRAVAFYRDALAANPSDLMAINNYAWHLATHTDSQVRNGEEAVRWAERGAQQSSEKDAGMLDTLAAAYAETSQFDRAVTVANRAVQLATESNQQAFADRIRQRRNLYRQQRAFRDAK